MVNLYEKLPERDVDILHKYMEVFGNYYVIKRCRMDYLLRYWNENKQQLYSLLGENFILEKSISYTRSQEDLNIDWQESLDNLALDFPFKYYNIIKNLVCEFNISLQCHYRLLSLANSLQEISSPWDDEEFIIPGSFTKSGKALKLRKGHKIMRFLGSFAKEFGLEKEYEEFRIVHSQVVNQTKIKGTLCLSIHPMDYVTMSDNDENWDSCMTWCGDGDYRAGTIEMMNSKYVIVAYIKTNRELNINNDFSWNSKKWRQLVIVDKDIILGNRQYPYENQTIENIALEWVKDLAETNLGYKYCDDPIQGIFEHASYGNITFTTGAMYNDIAIRGIKTCYLSANDENIPMRTIDFSGPLVCIECGEVITELEHINPSYVICPSCAGATRCYRCGNFGYDYKDGEFIGGNYYCDCCLQDIKVCPCCGKEMLHEHEIFVTDIEFPFSEYVCPECYDYILERHPEGTLTLKEWHEINR